jgi:hypothetical protein
MYTPFRIPFIVCAIASVQIPIAHAGVDVPALRDGPAVDIQMGQVRQSKRLVNGQENIQTGKLIDESTIERRFSDGCVTTTSVKDFYAPNTTWANCGQGPWSSGKVENMSVKGQLWPLKVGNVVHYQWKAINGEGQVNHRAFRSCEVTDTVMAEAAGKSYPSYRVDCSEHNSRKWVYFYAPGIDETVRFEDHHPKNGLRVMEFVERIQ